MSQEATPWIKSKADVIAVIVMAVALVLVLELHLLPALLAGLLVHVLVHRLAPRVFGLEGRPALARVVIVALLTVIVLALAAILVIGAIAFFRSEGGRLAELLQKMAEIIDGMLPTLPEWAQAWLPADSDAFKDATVEWLREHAAEVKTAGGEVARGIAYALIGMVIGALVALREVGSSRTLGPLARSFINCVKLLADAFRRVVFAQVRISAFNALLSAIYLELVLPAMAVHLPLKKTMIALTFVAGLLPIVGNLISNSVIVIISLSHSPPVALASLVFLIVVHKLEYFVNARIVGSQINAAAWELLLAMIVMEAAFGLPGVVAAPVFYAYAKSELVARKLV
ncbi:MAG: AI-2E family transporter [Burkholderiales bacterium]